MLKLVLFACLILAGAGCANSPTGSTLEQNTVMDRESVSERYSRIKHSTAIDQRAAHYEQSGLSPDDARTAAEIEYAKSGR